MSSKFVTALPVYNEVRHVEQVLSEVKRYSEHVVVVDDGSSDGTTELLPQIPGITVLTHEQNRGYGAALATAFDYAVQQGFDVVVTIDCDGQHQPQLIPEFAAAAEDAHIVSGSRYLEVFPGDSAPPEQRRRINARITAEINRRLGFNLTDAFCGFKAYQVPAVAKFDLSETGYAMPLELWVQAAGLELDVIEKAVPLIYLDEARSFGGALDDGATRLEYYHLVLDRSICKWMAAGGQLPGGAELTSSTCGGRTG